MAQVFASHSQIILAILANKGNNNYLSERGGLSFGIRRTFCSDLEGDGVVPITLAPEHEGDTVQGAILNEANVRGLKYEAPDLRTLKKGKLTSEMKDLLFEHMLSDVLMTPELHHVWE